MARVTYPLETIFRAFGLIFDYHTVEEAAKILQDFRDADGNSPAPATIKQWANQGELIGVNWFRVRELCENVRSRFDTESIIRNKPKEYQKFLEDAKSDLDKLQDIFITQVNKMQFKPADLAVLVKARRELQDEAEAKLQMAEAITTVVGEIIRAVGLNVRSNFKNNPEVGTAIEMLLAGVADEYQRFLAFGGDPQNYEINTGDAKANKRLQQRFNGSSEA